MTKLVSIGYSLGADEVFQDLFNEVVYINPSTPNYDLIEKDSVIIYEGGEDISPTIYNEKPSRLTFAGKISLRDAHEMAAFEKGRQVGAKHLGICRGAQLLCALSGGKLVQHVTGHLGTHKIEFTNTWRHSPVYTSSVHHQMMFPFGVNHKLIAKSSEKLSKAYPLSEEKIILEIPYEPEIVYFQDTKSLAIQGHPEFMDRRETFVDVCRQLVKEYLL